MLACYVSMLCYVMLACVMPCLIVIVFFLSFFLATRYILLLVLVSDTALAAQNKIQLRVTNNINT